MKLFARIFALSLVASGAVASTHIVRTSHPTVTAHASGIPIPMCPPSDPNGCGIGDGQ